MASKIAAIYGEEAVQASIRYYDACEKMCATCPALVECFKRAYPCPEA